MNRIHAPEIDDYEWCPASWRNTLTDVLRASSEWLHLFDSAAGIASPRLVRNGRALANSAPWSPAWKMI